ncbi:GLPGLI family protein [Flavobacterium solisilvae]|uniref:GLPGLI family protein n=1 Tax=Flavobacterium solisilvae TaxID=1852019 RepID=A0ABX1QQH1_9FLAO|nr:GLPGLI family protein [Flavobacterium solisilvae]NMH24382.1 GLPGLI family protein [Flavobacterium solisilvae]
MKKKPLTIILIFNFIALFAQNNIITINYSSSLDDSKNPYGAVDFKIGTLITDGKTSLYSERNIDTTLVLMDGDVMTFEKNDFIYNYSKNLVDKIILYKDRNIDMSNVIKDTTYKIDWEITGNFKEVMNYNCQEAICDFRGRKFKAYFLKDIPYADGPFKFQGLPGIILEVISEDGAVKITAHEISIDKDKIVYPFKDVKKFISYEDSIKLYQLKFDKVKNYQPDENVSVSIPNRFIEIYAK